MAKDQPLFVDARADRPPAASSQSRGFRTREVELFTELYRGLQLQTGQIVPPRKMFSPAEARSLLPYVSIMEIKEPGLALVRLVGTAIVNRTRIDNTGRNMLDLFPPETRGWSWDHFRRLLDTPCGCTFLSREDYENARVLVEVASFPLADQDGKAVFIVSLSVEIDRQSLMLRGEAAMQIAELHNYRYIDIGAGV